MNKNHNKEVLHKSPIFWLEIVLGLIVLYHPLQQVLLWTFHLYKHQLPAAFQFLDLRTALLSFAVYVTIHLGSVAYRHVKKIDEARSGARLLRNCLFYANTITYLSIAIFVIGLVLSIGEGFGQSNWSSGGINSAIEFDAEASKDLSLPIR